MRSRGLLRMLVVAGCGLAATAALCASAAADITVASANGQLTVQVRAKTGSDGDHAIVVERADVLGPKLRVRPQLLGQPPIAAGVGCLGNPVLNDAVCDFVVSFSVRMGDGRDNVVVLQPPIEFDRIAGCGPFRTDPFVVDLGGGDDVLTVGAIGICPLPNSPNVGFEPHFTARGGAGNDTVGGGPNDDRLFGDSGSDVLRGNQGGDVLNGGAGADQLDGGSGIDTVDYAGSTARVVVSIGGGGADGAVVAGISEGDSVGQSVETVVGSSFDDTLSVFDTAGHTLSGLGGNDALLGGGAGDGLDGGEGNDTLTGGAGVDTLLGGNGNDTIRAAGDGAADKVTCGGGTDFTTVDLVDFVNTNPKAPDCENVTRQAVDDGEPSRAVGRSLKIRADRTARITVFCPSSAGVDCAGTLTVGDPRDLESALATASYEIALGARGVVTVRFTSPEASQLRRRGTAAVQTLEQGISAKGPRSSLRTLKVR